MFLPYFHTEKVYNLVQGKPPEVFIPKKNFFIGGTDEPAKPIWDSKGRSPLAEESRGGGASFGGVWGSAPQNTKARSICERAFGLKEPGGNLLWAETRRAQGWAAAGAGAAGAGAGGAADAAAFSSASVWAGKDRVLDRASKND